jgi:hypothetical protein
MTSVSRAALLLLPALAVQAADFNRDIRPILSDKCFTCHGPDAANRKTKLRFDQEEGAKQDLGGRFAIVPGDPDRSELIRRVASDNKNLRMPPAYAGAAPLSAREISLLKEWVKDGAKWQKHWSLVAPTRPELPLQTKNPIDAFVLERLERDGFKPSPEAPRHTLIRRVALDLTGIPPTPAEVDAFVNDKSPDAYEQLVDRLLASPRYGERMAIRWLDAARYADTNGYQTDAERFMWRWRDWVINAFNSNMPFDRFTVEQIAGDLLPHPTLDQRIATGFNRNHRGNGEGGIIPEEYAVEYVVDRVETTSTVWLGLTMGCTRCHDHKYDPLTQKEFYQLFAFFNSIPERGKAFKYGNSPPMIPAPTPAQQQLVAEAEQVVAKAQKAFDSLDTRKAQSEWERKVASAKPFAWWPSRYMVASVDGEQTFDGKRSDDRGNVAGFDFYDRFTVSAWINPEALTGAIVTRALDIEEGTGWGIYLKNGKLQVNLVQRWLDDAGRVESKEAIEPGRWYHVAFTYDGTRVAEGIKIYLDGKPLAINVLVDEINQQFAVKDPLRIGGGGGPSNRFKGKIRDVRIYDRAINGDGIAVLAEGTSIPALAAGKSRTPAQQAKLSQCFLFDHAPARISESWKKLLDARDARGKLVDSLPTVMVMEDLPQPREAFRLIRGAYDRPGEKVARAVPAALNSFPQNAPLNRLGLAKWLVDPANPLTARVTVNRFWQMYFGTGLVKTTEDFGSQGEWPSHPALLDWLATEFIRTGWDVKAMQKLIVTSSTYKQASFETPEWVQRDPENRLLARGPRFRLPAEAVRDQALAISGLLVEKIGGPSVKPYQPDGLWKELSGGADYERDKGEALYRRSLYTYWKRAAPPPFMMNFDSAGRETCMVRETRTNTPLQALNLMNDVTYVEASRALAQRMIKEAPAGPEEKIAFAFKLATARDPLAKESEILTASFRKSLERFRSDGESAKKLLSEGDWRQDPKLDPAELAAYTMTASLILNLDETLTKE